VTGRRLLVTGATGGLGRAIVRAALVRGHAVCATGRSEARGAALEALGAQFVAIDLADPANELGGLVDGCESIIHAAALSASWGARADFERTNVDMTRRLLDAARGSGCRRFVYISSPSIFAAHRDQLGIGPHHVPARRPLNDYARTKLAAERTVLARSNDRLARCVIRPRALVGEGDEVILPRLAQLVGRKRIPLPGGGRALVELTDLRDAAEAVLRAEDRALDVAGQAINISGGQPIAVKEVAERLGQALGRRPEMIDLPLPVARAVAVGLEWSARIMRRQCEPMLTHYTLATLGYSQTFDLAPAEHLLGYRPQYDALETLLEQARFRAAP